MKRRCLLATAAILLLPTIARADATSDCNDIADTARKVRGCTQLIGQTTVSETKSTAYLNRGIAYAEGHEWSKALADFSASIVADPSNFLASYNRGNVFFDLRRYHQAVTEYTKAIAFDPSLTLAFLNRGLANERLHIHAASVSDFRAALALEPNLVKASAGLKRLGASSQGERPSYPSAP
jgi:tetratricopeptide (TPR) repeat protein